MSTTAPSPKPLAQAVDGSAPVLLDLGQQKPKAVKRLRKGKGKLFDDVLATIEELKTVGTISATAQPLIVLVEKKPTAKSLFPMLVK
jgi:hypothetical protein